MDTKRQLMLFPAIFMLAACAFAQDVHYNYERGANFASYRTYTWVTVQESASMALPSAAAPKVELPGPLANLPAPPANLPAPPAGLPDIPSSGVAKASNAPGLPFGIRNTDTGDPLMDQEIRRAVDEQLAQKGLARVEKNADLVVVYHVALHEEKSLNLSSMAWGSRGSGWWDGSTQGQTSSIPIGTLVVDVYDASKKELIWRGDATKTIDLKTNPNKNYKDLQKAMAKLFKNYPPPPNK